jgi:hypothetical protein
MKGKLGRLFFVCMFSVQGFVFANTANDKSPIGINLTGISYWSTQWMLVDIMKQASNGSGELWATTNADTYNFNTGHQSELQLDEKGWPRSLPARDSQNFHYVSTVLYQDNEHHPAGDFIVLYDGEGKVAYNGGSVIESSPGRDVVRLTPVSHFHLQIQQTDPNKNGNYIRNIRVLVPGGTCGSVLSYASSDADCVQGNDYVAFENNYQQQLFHPLFLQDMKKFSALRFMRFLGINNSPLRTWDERAKASDASWALKAGSPVEVAVAMANQLQAEPWINLPFRVDDDFIRQEALLVKQELDQHLTLYLEMGNELWNNAYPYIFDAQYAEQQGKATWPEAGVSDFEYRLNYYGMRAAQSCAIWKAVFSDAPERVKCVMAGMGANTWVNERALTCPLYANQGGHNCARDMSALAIAPYFGGYLADDANLDVLAEWAAQGEQGLSQLFDEMYNGVLRPLTDDPEKEEWQLAPANGALEQAKNFIAANSALAQQYGLQLVAYEGGQHLTYAGNLSGDRGIINDNLFLAANRDSRMGQALMDHFDHWQQLGGTTYMVFESTGSFGAFGAFPLKEYQLQNASPKYTAVRDYIVQNPCWWQGCERTTVAYEDAGGSNPDDPEPPETGSFELTTAPLPETMGIALSWQWTGPEPQYFNVFHDGQMIGQTLGVAREFTLNWLSLRKDYAIQVVAVAETGELMLQSNTVVTQAGDSEAPTQPAALQVEFDGQYGFELSWEASQDNVAVAHYKIFRNGEAYTHVTEPGFHDQWPPQGDVTYHIVAEDSWHNLSKPSLIVSGFRPNN